MGIYSLRTMMRQALVLLVAPSLRHNGSHTVAFGLVPRSSKAVASAATRQRRGFGSPAAFGATLTLLAKPKKAGSTVDGYQTVSVNCAKCRQRLFRYKKKNGTKSNLVKCYIERISEDSAGVLALAAEASDRTQDAAAASSPAATNARQRKGKRNNNKNPSNGSRATVADAGNERPKLTVPAQLDPGYAWLCPGCDTQFARSSLIHGRPALKLVGGKIRMTKK